MTRSTHSTGVQAPSEAVECRAAVRLHHQGVPSFGHGRPIRLRDLYAIQVHADGAVAIVVQNVGGDDLLKRSGGTYPYNATRYTYLIVI